MVSGQYYKRDKILFPCWPDSAASFLNREYIVWKKENCRTFLEICRLDDLRPFNLRNPYFTVNCPTKSRTRTPSVCSVVFESSWFWKLFCEHWKRNGVYFTGWSTGDRVGKRRSYGAVNHTALFLCCNRQYTIRSYKRTWNAVQNSERTPYIIQPFLLTQCIFSACMHWKIFFFFARMEYRRSSSLTFTWNTTHWQFDGPMAKDNIPYDSRHYAWTIWMQLFT